ncbi:hypothetical protein [Actinocatenispora rupis]|uniref:Uncharacterized protein n=1 Tax=Actinocatenispora rupis TaxID=519421 RepID=A0A8J3NC70_9ACTN|nr:hypothetical protein [Actinocatenispora rupis]GID10109.1 hypothetical protein Aru02nite_09980 [Actinocatenispora rupis]
MRRRTFPARQLTARGREQYLNVGGIGGGVLTKAIGTLPDHAQPGEREEIQDVFQSPDHTGLLIATDRGWYTGPADGSTAPQYAFEHLGGTPATPEDSVVLGWAPAHVIEP